MQEIRLKTNTDNDIICTFDKHGNVYFSSDKTADLYDLTITNTNTLLCEKYNIKNDLSKEDDIIVGTLVLFNDNETLRGKIIKETAESDTDSNSDNELTDDIYKKYLVEDLEYNEYIERHNTNEPYFSFNIVSKNSLKNSLNKIIFDRESTDALYDTIIYDTNIIMKTTLVNDRPLYRLRIFKSGDIKFRAIGGNEISYKISYNDNNEIFLIE